ncbi:MAG: F0F1 ATP synthase subunit delta [Succinivibrionaceae bacterium]|nr:F0F1 ATP synthase subunit delta [Succinivibrionaceae bacterium]
MAENLTVARPYAEAVFQTALEENDFQSWQAMLYAMALVCSDESVLTKLKGMTSKEEATNQVLSLLDGILSEEGQNFVKILGENERFEVLPDIYKEYRRLWDRHEKVMPVELISARPIADSDVNELTAGIAAKYQCKVSLKKTIDENLIGGAILKIGDKVIDASVRTSLDNLASTLK